MSKRRAQWQPYDPELSAELERARKARRVNADSQHASPYPRPASTTSTARRAHPPPSTSRGSYATPYPDVPQQSTQHLTSPISSLDKEVVDALNARRHADPELRAIIAAVNTNGADTAQRIRFQQYVQMVKDTLAIQKRQERAPYPPPQRYPGSRSDHARPNATPHLAPLATAPAPPPTCVTQATSRGQMPSVAPALHVSRPEPSIPPASPARSSYRTGLPSRVRRPMLRHSGHPDSGVGANFHCVPYPISLLPFKSWEALHNNTPDGAVCSSCQQPRLVSVHQRKLFLVAERLSWLDSIVPSGDRSRNEEALWAVNAELEIWEPAVEDEQIVIGGRLSVENQSFPFRDEQEAEVVLKLVATVDILTKHSWEVWRWMIEIQSSGESTEAGENSRVETDLARGRQPLGDISANSRWLPSNEHTTKVKGKDRAIIESLDLSGDAAPSGLPTPPSSGEEVSPPATRSCIRTLQDFYSILDKLERTSPMGARFLEAYAERLRDELCNDCWFNHNVLDDDQLEDPIALSRRPVWKRSDPSVAMFAR